MGLLCVDPAYQPVVTSYGIMSAPSPGPDQAAVKRLGVSVTFFVSDMIQYRAAFGMKKICNADYCLDYRRTCDDKVSRCEYTVGTPVSKSGRDCDMILPVQFNIAYASQDSLKAAENAILLGRAET